MRGLRLQFPSDVSILYEDEGDCAAGLYEEGVELLSAEKLRKPMTGLTELESHGPDKGLALWFHDFEKEAQKRGIPIVQWVDALMWHASSARKSETVKIRKEYIKRKVPSQVLYAAVCDHLLDSAGDAYYPLTYLEQIGRAHV